MLLRPPACSPRFPFRTPYTTHRSQVADLIVNSGIGFGVGVVASVLLFRRESSPRSFATSPCHYPHPSSHSGSVSPEALRLIRFQGEDGLSLFRPGESSQRVATRCSRCSPMNVALTRGAASEPVLPTQMCVTMPQARHCADIPAVQLLPQPLRSPRDQGPPLEPRMTEDARDDSEVRQMA